MPKKVCGASKTSQFQPSPQIPPPRALSDPVAPSLPCFFLPAILGAGGGRNGVTTEPELGSLKWALAGS